MDATPYHPLLRRKLQQTLAPSGEPEEEPNEDLSIIAVICCALFFIVFSVLLVHDFRTRKRSLAEARRSEDIAEESDRRLLQIGEKERLAKREERREWYANYFKPCTMEVKQSDLFYAPQENAMEKMVPPPETDDHEEDSDSTGYTATNDSSGDDSENSDDVEYVQVVGPAHSIMNETAEHNDCGTLNGETHLCIRLPINADQQDTDTSCRTVLDAQCAICLGEYEAGDKVVWSALECQHAFHHECILTWLSKGKKKCPICRHWFVPSSLLKNQKKALAAEMERSAATGDDKVIEDIEMAANETTVNQDNTGPQSTSEV